jgi:hypothetical protein
LNVVAALDHPAASKIVAIAMLDLLAAEDAAALVLCPVKLSIPDNFKTSLSQRDI